MPRGCRKEKNYSEEIEKIESKIAYHTNSIKNLKEQKQKIELRQKSKEIKVMDIFLKEHNLSPKDVIEFYTSKMSAIKVKG